MKKIAFDVMGNDNGVKAAIEAALDFVKKNLDYIFILVGDQDEISKYTLGNERIQIIDVKKVVSVDNKAFDARHDESSMSVAIKLVADGKADGVISAGNSAMYITLTTLILKRMGGVKRPAFMPIFPTTTDRRLLVLDVGANVQTTSEMLVQWAKMGSIFSKVILNVENPKIGLLNIGTEANKGFDFHIEAHTELLKDKDINYLGYYEPRNVLTGDIDVLVCDGYGGNLVLKTAEGTVLAMSSLIKRIMKSKLKLKIGALIAKKGFVAIKNQLDYRNVGGAWVLGLNGLAIKAHGSSDVKAYTGALNQLRDAIEKDALSKFKGAFNV